MEGRLSPDSQSNGVTIMTEEKEIRMVAGVDEMESEEQPIKLLIKALIDMLENGDAHSRQQARAALREAGVTI